MTAEPVGVDAARVGEWFAAHVPQCRPPLRYRLIAGGHSNLTFEVADAAGARWVLRRPPLGHVLPTAHDMEREHRILAAMHGTDVPVPATVALCTDRGVNGAPFYVMAMVDGEVLRDSAAAERALDPDGRRALGLRLADTLAAIHSVVPADVGLGDLGRPEGYITRQLKRWKGQLDDSRTRPLEQLDALHQVLAERIPEQRFTGLVHGDFRLDNCMVGADARVRAVLDWELCTQGDTLADLGMLMVYWSSPSDDLVPLEDPPTLAEGFPSRDEMLERYAATRGIELCDIDYYVAFSYWRLACITEGVYARYLNGDMGDRVDEAKPFEQRVLDLATAAARITGSW
ncbi:phosphotransferase family protein [Acidiferrimicrobium sp. IK]|uniref:phosphotransferase family protein n=1 Tax=Acidiferrimicrobium sp. IK TaxID=2871700 RepID=UPI0021CB99C5|nr:phosphotransferase family protein [Acidiferrimicrobium sp. IK]MCU4183273.1 phosphotransferase family protein [Acidiferrimicrobium sp. IK]